MVPVTVLCRTEARLGGMPKYAVRLASALKWPEVAVSISPSESNTFLTYTPTAPPS